MKATIDKAGRVVIPAAIREQLGLEPGTELELTVTDDLGLHVARKVAPPELVRRGGRLVVRPTVAPERRPRLDVASLVDKERDRWPL
jgi:AbrB family looped-hinge helix DNA binding protein